MAEMLMRIYTHACRSFNKIKINKANKVSFYIDVYKAEQLI